jgi:hypothetical protein
MSPDENPLDAVWAAYITTKDCLKIADRARNQASLELLRKTGLILLSDAEASEQLTMCHDESENFAVLSMWAVFERFIIDYLRDKGRHLMEIEPKGLSEPFYSQLEASVEYWRIEDILDILKGVVDSRLIGDAKNIKKYRDWVAHKNPRRSHEGKTDPKLAYSILSQIIESIIAAG